MLVYAFYYLAKASSPRERSREEVGAKFGKAIAGEFTHQDVAGLELLDGVVDETVGMHNPPCNNGARNVLPDRMMVEEVYPGWDAGVLLMLIIGVSPVV